MSGLYILSNNDSIVNFFKQFQQPGMPEVRYIEASATRVLQLAKEAIHKGARLLNHPLAGSNTPGDSPFKTLLVSGEGEGGTVLHFQSMQLIEEALRTYAKAAKNRYRAYSDDQLKEFKSLDVEMTLAAIQGLAASMREG
jgi:hypothetical protein